MEPTPTTRTSSKTPLTLLYLSRFIMS